MKHLCIALACAVSSLSAAAQAGSATGPSSSAAPYVTPTAPGWSVTALITVGDAAQNGYRMVGIPDGLGAYDNGDGTFTVLMNHELAATAGIPRAHGANGAFVSEWVVSKSSLQVLAGADLASQHRVWTGSGHVAATGAANRFARLCSADLPAVSAFYHARSGLGAQNRIFMNGEEAGAEGRAYAFIASGADKGKAFELPRLGKFSWENSLANPWTGDQTVVVGLDDSSPGQVYVYVGNKTRSGLDIDKAGLTNGSLHGIRVDGIPAETSTSTSRIHGRSFDLVALDWNQTGANLNAESIDKGVTNFARPEDGHWADADTFYFATTGMADVSSKLWKLDFNASLSGGVISLVVDSETLTGSDGARARNFDNLFVAPDGKIILQEDPGNSAYLAKTWEFDPVANQWTQIFESNRAFFQPDAAGFLTQDEENSGIVEVTEVLGRNDARRYFLGVSQAHYRIPGEQVEGGQLYLIAGPL